MTSPPAWPYNPLDTTSSWRPGHFRRIPYTGLLFLLAAFCATIAALAILVTSDGTLTSAWKYPPNVYISIVYTISNISLAAAFSEAVTLNWWIKAIKSGTKLGDLHRYWLYGTAPVAALFSGRNFNFIAFAALFVAVSPINGPLLQRASSVSEAEVHSLVNLSFPAATEVVQGTGFISGRSYSVPLFTDEYNKVVQAFYRGDDMPASDAGCGLNGKCSGRLVAAGLLAKCENSTAPFDAGMMKPNGSINFDTTDVFQSQFFWSGSGAPGNVSLAIQYKDEAPCSGELQVKNCTLQAAKVRYPVVIDGASNTISLDPATDIFADEVLEVKDYPIQMYGMTTPIGGFATALSNRYNGMSHLFFSGAAGYTLSSDGPTGPQFADTADVTDYTTDMCKIKFNDPAPFLLQQARELMFRTAIAQGNASTIQVIHPASEARTASVYRTHYEYMGGAVAVNICAVLIVLATFKGYWHLGRNVSMSPLEIAKAFNAPLLADQNSNGTAGELVNGAGQRPVRYGIITSSTGLSGAREVQPVWKDGEMMELKPMPSTPDLSRSPSPSPGAQARHLEIADAVFVQPLQRS